MKTHSFYFNFFGRHKAFCGTNNTPVLNFWWRLSLMDFSLARFLTCMQFPRFTSGATPADCIEVNMAAKPFWSVFLCLQALLEIQGSNPQPSMWRAQWCKLFGQSGLAHSFRVTYMRLNLGIFDTLQVNLLRKIQALILILWFWEEDENISCLKIKLTHSDFLISLCTAYFLRTLILEFILYPYKYSSFQWNIFITTYHILVVIGPCMQEDGSKIVVFGTLCTKACYPLYLRPAILVITSGRYSRSAPMVRCRNRISVKMLVLALHKVLLSELEPHKYKCAKKAYCCQKSSVCKTPPRHKNDEAVFPHRTWWSTLFQCIL